MEYFKSGAKTLVIKHLEDFKNKASPIIEKLSEFYQIENGNIEGLYEKISDITSVDEMKTEVNEENSKILKEKVYSWVKEGEDLKQLYKQRSHYMFHSFQQTLKSSSHPNPTG